MWVPGNLLICVWSSIGFQAPQFRLSRHQIPRLAHGDRRNLHGSVSRFLLRWHDPENQDLQELLSQIESQIESNKSHSPRNCCTKVHIRIGQARRELQSHGWNVVTLDV